MNMFIVRDVATNEILWEGAEFSSGIICMVSPDSRAGLPTLFINRVALRESFWRGPEVLISWKEVVF